MAHAEWALKFKTKGTELRNIRGKYYLYRISSKWDKERKITRKITHEMIGSITEKDGLIPSGTKKNKKDVLATELLKNISTKEYGATYQLQAMSEDILAELKTHFPDIWEELFVLACNRLLYQSPLKNMSLYYEESFISEQLQDLDLSKNTLTSLMQKIGNDREKVAKFMTTFVEGSEHLLFDITDVVSQSKKIKMSAKGYNSHYNFDPQVNLFYMFASDTQTPVFYRTFPGNISGMKALELSIKEAGVKNALVIGDKGFCSEENINMLEATGLNYILPVRRDSSYLNYERLKSREYDLAYDGHFMHYGRPIFHYTITNYTAVICHKKPEEYSNATAYLYRDTGCWQIDINNRPIAINNKALEEKLSKINFNDSATIIDAAINQELRSFLIKNKIKGINFELNKKVVVFLDEALRGEEERSYLARINDKCEGYDMDKYQDKQLSFGTIGMITNASKKDPQAIYVDFKTRMEVETVFDAYKNLLEADRSYMQSDASINAWMFINHLSVMLYYKLLNLIKSKDMISQISPRDVLIMLQRINKVKINQEWYLGEINSKSVNVLAKLGITVT